MIQLSDIERRLVWVLAAIAVVAILGVLAILPYRLYERDIRVATVNAHQASSLVHTALSQGLVSGQDVSDLVNRFQGNADFEIRLAKLEQGTIHPAATSRKGSSTLDGTDLTYVAPPILDRSGGTWVASMYFDLAPMKRRSIRLIVDLVLAVALGSMVFSGLVFVVVRRSLLGPLRTLTTSIEEQTSSGAPLDLPEFHTGEMRELTEAIERACTAVRTQAQP